MENLFTHLEQVVLRMDSRFCTEDGHLLKNNVVEAALALDPKLLHYLLADEKLRKQFFREVDGLLVFDKVQFQRFVMNKQFLPDSYTSFKNKVGLTNENGEFLSESREIVLSWPYKDCMLEGGQTKEDAKRNEIFWNETLAPDEINRLTEPKALCNFRRYDSKGEHETTELLPDDNLIIKGNNLLALYSLRQRFRGKVKLIYIDPPYNTGSNADTFVYNNTFKHTTWLTFMKNRLEIAKQLLTKDGAIIVAIDENERDYLGVLLKEMFGNYEVHCISIIHNPRGVQGTNFSYTNEFAYFVIPEKKKTIIDRKIRREEIEWSPLRNWGTESERSDAKNCFYPIIINPTNGEIMGFGDVSNEDFHPQKNVTNGLYIDIYPIDAHGIERKWRYARQSVDGIKHLLRTVEKNGVWDIELGKDFGQYKTVWDDPRYDANEYGTKIIKDLVPNCPFKFPKSLWNVFDCLYAVVGKDPNAIVLDFFGGSGTTAHAVLELNKLDGGNRKFILTEQMDYVESVTCERVKEVIKRNKTNSFVYCELAQANQQLVDEIMAANESLKLQEVWTLLQEKGFMSYKVSPKLINEHAEDFNDLSLEDQKRFLIECLDKNMLYIPYSDIDDEGFTLSENDKQLTRLFYASR
ncbi:MAG: site-specific DNA-methyltransferase [Paludibacteraceae bacterium]|nr:site-specific DNA-methyltransferase [Paludibacteraceae bacterium]